MEEQHEISADETWRLIHCIARLHARRNALSAEHVEDCAGEFVLKILSKSVHIDSQTSLCRDDLALLHKYAADFTCDYRRALWRQERHECAWPQIPAGQTAPLDASENEAFLDSVADPQARVDTTLLQEVFWEELYTALATLTPWQRQVLLRHCLHQQPLTHIAARTHKTPYAVAQALYRARTRLRLVWQVEQEG